VLTTLSGLQSTPVGRIRLLCPRLAAKTVVGPKLGQFVRDYPGVELEITTDDSRLDLVSAGYDAGIQFGEYIAQDMVAVRVSPDLRPAIAAAPAYFASHPTPTAPRDVLNHECIRFRHRGEGVYKWEFDKGDESLAIAVNGSLLLDELDLIIQAALDGAGLAWVAEDRIAEHLESGALIRVLEDWCPPFPGFFLYYPTRKQQPPLSRPHHHTPARRVTRQSAALTRPRLAYKLPHSPQGARPYRPTGRLETHAARMSQGRKSPDHPATQTSCVLRYLQHRVLRPPCCPSLSRKN
jgi:DNA-binding transcriptional LysR family regulator